MILTYDFLVSLIPSKAIFLIVITARADASLCIERRSVWSKRSRVLEYRDQELSP